MLGLGIKKVRRARNITQEQLAERLGVSRQAVSMWESGKRELKASTFERIAKILDVTLDEIIKLKKPLKSRKDKEMFKFLRTKKTKLKLHAPEASRVAVTGDFKGWDNEGIPMRRNIKGIWNVGLDLEPGSYEYKFIVDGQWINDPVNKNSIENSFGTLNSVLKVEH